MDIKNQRPCYHILITNNVYTYQECHYKIKKFNDQSVEMRNEGAIY